MTETAYPPEALDLDVRRLLEINEQTDLLKTEADTIKRRLRALGAGKHPAPCGVTVSISPTRRFNPELAQQRLPPQLLELCTRTVVDAKTAKAVLPPAVYADCMAEAGEPRVSLA